MAAFDLDQAIVDLVAKGDVKVPPYPAVAFGIEKLLRDGDYGLDDLARLISSDQVLAADVLRAGNSAFYARGAQVASVKQAVGRVGAKDVAKLALASGLGAHAVAAGPLAPLRRKAWSDALASALLCQALARGRGLPPDVAFSAGLLHDFGRVIALACIEGLVAKHGDLAPRAAEEWTATVDRYHVELGIVMAARWQLPPVLADVLSLHHAENISAAADPRLVETVMAVDEVVALLGERPSLSADELADAALVEPSEHGAISYAIEALPGFVASFEGGDAERAAGGPSLVAPPPRPEPPPSLQPQGPNPAPHEVVLTLGGRKHVYKVLGIASTHFMLSGPLSAPENMLMEMSVRCEPPLDGYASVKLAWPEGGAFTLLVQPYALTGDQARRWRELVAQSTARG
jgi:HD-like signal output (HDOD) protein